MNNNLRLATVLFTAIPILATLYLFVWAPGGQGWLHLPNWLIGFFIIEVIFCVLMWWFIKKVWV